MLREESLGDIDRSLVNVELNNCRTGLKCAEICHQIPQTKRRVNVFGVQCRQDDLSHRKLKSTSAPAPRKSGCFQSQESFGSGRTSFDNHYLFLTFSAR